MPRHLGLVAVGGALGTLARHVVAELVDPATVWPWPTFIVNVVGAFLLGALVGRIADAADPRRLLLGTGLLGGFTTYSAFAVEVDQLARAGHGLAAVAYPAASVVVGVLVAFVGLVVAGRRAS